MDGKEFFRQARARLSYEKFSQFLSNIKELNAHKQTRQETLARASEIFGDANADLQPLVESKLDEPSVDDGDLFEAVDPVQVRQDKGVQFGADEPDWELIEKLEEIASKDEIVVPDVPEAPDLDAVAQTPREESDTIAPNASDVAHLATTARDPTVAFSSEGAQEPSWDLTEGEDLWGGVAQEEE